MWTVVDDDWPRAGSRFMLGRRFQQVRPVETGTWPPLVLPGYVYIGQLLDTCHCLSYPLNDRWIDVAGSSTSRLDAQLSFHRLRRLLADRVLLQRMANCRSLAASQLLATASQLTISSSERHLFTEFQYCSSFV